MCGHPSYGDIKVLLQRNGLWDYEVQQYLTRVIERCVDCKATSEPKQARKVSLSTMTTSSNQVVCIDHFHLDEMRVFHIMDSATRFSSSMVVPDTSMHQSLSALESQWISYFSTPEVLLYDHAFENRMFRSYLGMFGNEARPIPPAVTTKTSWNQNTGSFWTCS